MPNKGIFLHYTHYQSPQWCPTNILYAFIQLQWKFYLQFGRKIDLNHLHLSLSACADETATNRTTAAANKFFILKKKSTWNFNKRNLMLFFGLVFTVQMFKSYWLNAFDSNGFVTIKTFYCLGLIVLYWVKLKLKRNNDIMTFD